MAEFTPTPSQRAAIETTGRSVLVSAAAGSGKTAVLAERCGYLVAVPRPPCPIDRLLVVTFTDAAAAEMRERIADVLRKRLQGSPANRWLQQQLALLDSASISTIHSFCRQVLNRYFAQADLDPQSPLMDADDASLLRQETARQVFDALAERSGPTGEAFLDLLASYGGSSEQGLIRRVLHVDSFLNSIPDPEAWVKAAAARYEARGPEVLPDAWARLLADTLRTELAEQRDAVARTLAGLPHARSVVSASATVLREYQGALEEWLGLLERGGDAPVLDRVCRDGIGAYGFPSLPRRSGKFRDLPPADQEAFVRSVDTARRIRDELFERRLKDTFGRFRMADWAEGVVRTKKHAEMFLSLVTTVREAYQDAKREQGVLDFADLERMTLNLLRNEANGVAARLRSHYEHVLVDEFQDVNPVQAEILRVVSREGESDRPGNLFAVGDVKQSIYRFRLAEPQLFLDRRNAFSADNSSPGSTGLERGGKAGITIDLVENFRSRRCVLDAINRVFERIMASDLGRIAYDDHARLKPGRKETDVAAGVALELHVLDEAFASGDDGADRPDEKTAFDWERIEREAYVIAERIRALAETGTPYRDIAILLRSMQPRAALLLRTLSQLGIPVFADSTGGFFDAMEILDVLSLLELMDNEQQDIPLAGVLRSPLAGRPLIDDELVMIRTAAGRAAPPRHFHEAVRRYARHGADERLREHLAALLGRLGAWREHARRRPLADVLWGIYEDSGYLAYVSGLPDGMQRRANLLRLHEYARQFGTFRRQGLHRFLQFIHGLQDAGEDLDAGSVVSSSQDVVRVMTVHRSKGLEFPVVILGELGKRFNLSDTRGSILFDRRLGIALEAVDTERNISYPTLPHRIVARGAESETLAEEMRILYVALTRARERLILVGTKRLSAFEADQNRYAGHEGVLPALDRRGAGSALDWVSAAICCQPPERVSFDDRRAPDGSAPLFEVHTYDGEQMKQWTVEPPQDSGVTKRLQRCSRMGSLPDARHDGADDAVVQTVARRLTVPYAMAALTRVPAVAAASTLKRRWDTRQDELDPAAAWPEAGSQASQTHGARSAFPEPAFLDRDRTPDQALRGTWTHECLQRLDLARSCDASDLRAQLEDLVETGAIQSDHAAAVDVDSVAWFFGTSLGRRLRSGGTRVLREWPFVLGVDPSRYDPSTTARDREDLMLVRGIVDCLFDAGDGWEVLDYKTDVVTVDGLADRAAGYKGQLDIYTTAVEATWHSEVARRWLVFLSARQIIEV